MLDDVADFGLGVTIAGQNDEGVDINVSYDGREYTFPVNEDVAAALGFSRRVIGKRITAVVLRNKTGAAVLPGEVVTVDVASGVEGLGQAAAKSSANDDLTYVVDPQLPATGCADNDLFLAIVAGPTKIKQPGTPVSLVVGDKVKAGATGRLAKSTTVADECHLHLGTIVEANNVADALVPVLLHPVWR